ncbi:MAG: acyl-protein synthetase [Candidatus Zixiibacteriota bacterium]|nr:MAG: acyl-protein synthetase [candidate division Zixibacteria bacterium]
MENIFSLPPYEMLSGNKQRLLVDRLNQLNVHHQKRCEPYRKIHRAWGTLGREFDMLEEFPFLPIRLFKDFDLMSITQEEVIKTLTSSGTTSSEVSKIYLDRTTSQYQTKALSIIIQDFIGKRRLPMLIIDSRDVIKNRRQYSARGAGLLGFSNFGRDHCYILDENMSLKLDELQGFLDVHRGETVLLFGFTFMVWQHFYKELTRRGISPDLKDGILIHSGGWKKLSEEAVDNITFKRALNEVCGIRQVHNFYGMVEQVGSVFMECGEGYFHAPVYSDIIVRETDNWSALGFKQPGIVELVSVLPHSYPGHVLLTEDMGEIIGEDDCPCGRKGKYFHVVGRVPKAEIRGCSDTYALEDEAHAV